MTESNNVEADNLEVVLKDEDLKIQKGSPVLVIRNGIVRLGVSKVNPRSNGTKLKLKAFGMKNCISEPKDSGFVPVTLFVSKEVADYINSAIAE